MKKNLMVAATLMLLMISAAVLSACSSSDNPVEQMQSVSLVESKYSAPDYGMNANNQIYAGSYSLVLTTSNPSMEIVSDDFTVSTESKEQQFVPGWPTAIINAALPEVKMKGNPYKRADGKWTMNFEVFLPYTTQQQQLNITLFYKGKPLGSNLQLDYVNPAVFSYEGSTDGYLYVGKTYPMSISYYNENKLFDYNSIVATGVIGMKPAHSGEFEVGYEAATGKPYVKILDTFAFTDEEIAAGYAVVCPCITTLDDELFQPVPVKAVVPNS